MVDAWPGTLPQRALVSGYNEEQEDAVANFQSSIGRPIRRRRASIVSTKITFSMVLNTTQYNTLLTFYNTTLKAGTLRFTMPHPRTGVTINAEFLGPPKVSALMHDKFSIQMGIAVI